MLNLHCKNGKKKKHKKTLETNCVEWRQRSHMNDGLQAVIKINGYIIKRSNYDIFIVFSTVWQ